MIRLIGTDFDETVHYTRGRRRFDAELLEWLRAAQAAGTKWAVLSGRELNRNFTDKLQRLRGSPMPDFIVTIEREIFVRHNGCYHPDTKWNEHCRAVHDELFAREVDLIRALRRWLRRHTKAKVYSNKWSALNIRALNMGEADAIHRELRRRFDEAGQFTFARNTLFLRVSHHTFTKGHTLGEIARRLGAPKETVFAAGDHYNDLTMLDGTHAGMIAAPANAIPEVKALVRQVGGYIASRPCGLGVLEAFRFFESRDDRNAVESPRWRTGTAPRLHSPLQQARSKVIYGGSTAEPPLISALKKSQRSQIDLTV